LSFGTKFERFRAFPASSSRRKGETMARMIGLSLAAAIGLTAAMASAQEGMKIARACGDDIDRLCAGVPPGEGRIKACMKAHMTELSAPCMDTLLAAIAAEKEPE